MSPYSQIQLINGRASTEGTLRYADRFASRFSPNAFRSLGSTGLTVSAIGFGAYRISLGNSINEKALEKALLEGCNVIDTAPNYGDGKSEQLIGRVLTSLCSARQISRDEITLISKVGFVQGQTKKLAHERELQGTSFPQISRLNDKVWYCLHPTFIEEEITRSLQRLNVDCLDVLLIQNPEILLAAEQHLTSQKNTSALKKEAYLRLEEAFAYLEKEVARGRVGFYGVSSNVLSVDSEAENALCLAKVLNAAKSNPHFQVIELPFNLLEQQTLLHVIPFTQAKNLAIIVNRPLNAIEGVRLFRLADRAYSDKCIAPSDFLSELNLLEREFHEQIAPVLRAQGISHLSKLFRFLDELETTDFTILSHDDWQQIKTEIIFPQIYPACSRIEQHLSGELRDRWISWKERYLTFFETISELPFFSSEYSRKKQFFDRLSLLLPKSLRERSYSQKALGTLLQTEGISCILNGMRTKDYVEDSLGALQIPPFSLNTLIHSLSLTEAGG